MKRRTIATLLTLVLVFALSGCGSKSANSPAMENSASYVTMDAPESPMEADGYWAEEAQMETSDSEGNTAGTTIPADVKMIYRASMELESTEFDKATADIATLVEQLGGYFEQRSVRNYSSGYHYANYTVRVPSEKFQDFLGQIGNVCHVTYKTDSAENITERYYDTQSRLKTAQIKLERLQELLTRAENMEDIITIENAIGDVEYEIEYYSGELRHYDALVGYATIDISLNEVQKLTEVETEPPTFGQRVASAFRDGIEDFGYGLESFIEWLAYSWLTLLVIAAAVVILIKLIRRGRAKRATDGGERKKLFGRKRKSASAEQTTENQTEE